MVKEKMSGRELSSAQVDEISDQVAIAAIKYTILRQAIGGDVIFDSAKSISFEGDSGPYLQYSAVRAQAVLEKAEKEGIKVAKNSAKATLSERAGLLEKLIVRFPDIVVRARVEYAPQHIAGYLINLAGAFNSFYGNQTIADAKDPLSPYYVALTKSFRTTMTNGLWLLGIKVPEKM
jgi:arginyl-tRNA synthetase